MNKKLVCGLFFLFLAVLIVRPVIGSVNITDVTASVAAATSLMAEGDPMPSPSGPHAFAATSLVAEGDPMPSPSGPHGSIS